MVLRIRGCHPYCWPFQTILLALPGSAGPRSLATTNGVSIDFLSSGYLDVSVPRVCSKTPMYSGLKYLFHPIMHHLREHNRMSGGFPHSDIHGSKPVPGSPWLNAGYHVLHRLLLPRHPPNALFALDLIQKEHDRAGSPSPLSSVKSCILSHACNPLGSHAVSVLDLNNIAFGHVARSQPILG